MQFLECKEEKIGVTYGYRIEIEEQLLKALSGRRSDNRNDSRTIRIISKTLRLSLLEAYTLSWLLKSSQGLNHLNEAYMMPIEWYQSRKYSLFFLQLLLNGYYVKSFLASPILWQIQADIETILPNFTCLYAAWRPRIPLSQLRIEELNKPFNELSQSAISGLKDYNVAVSKILLLSKSYNIGGKDQTYPQKSLQQEMREVSSQSPRLVFDPQSHLSLQQPNHPFDFEERYSMHQQNMEPVFRPFGASSGRGELKDINLGSIFESKNMLDSLREEQNQAIDLSLSKSKNKKKKSIKHTFSFFEEEQQ